MTTWSPASVEKALWETSEEVNRSPYAVNDAYVEMLRTAREYDHAVELAYLNATGPAHERKYRALSECHELREAKDVADAAYRLVASQAAALKVKVETLRSIGTSVRQAYENAGRGEW